LKIVIDIFMGMGNCMLNARFVLLNFIILFSQIQSHDSDRPLPFHDEENRKTYPLLINPPHASRPSNKIVTNHDDDEQILDYDNQEKYKFFITSPQLEKLKKIAELSKKRAHKYLDTSSKYYQEKIDQLSDSVENSRDNVSQLISIFLASQNPILLGGEIEQHQGRKRFNQRPKEKPIQKNEVVVEATVIAGALTASSGAATGIVVGTGTTVVVTSAGTVVVGTAAAGTTAVAGTAATGGLYATVTAWLFGTGAVAAGTATGTVVVGGVVVSEVVAVNGAVTIVGTATAATIKGVKAVSDAIWGDNQNSTTQEVQQPSEENKTNPNITPPSAKQPEQRASATTQERKQAPTVHNKSTRKSTVAPQFANQSKQSSQQGAKLATSDDQPQQNNKTVREQPKTSTPNEIVPELNKSNPSITVVDKPFPEQNVDQCLREQVARNNQSPNHLNGKDVFGQDSISDTFHNNKKNDLAKDVLADHEKAASMRNAAQQKATAVPSQSAQDFQRFSAEHEQSTRNSKARVLSGAPFAQKEQVRKSFESGDLTRQEAGALEQEIDRRSKLTKKEVTAENAMIKAAVKTEKAAEKAAQSSRQQPEKRAKTVSQSNEKTTQAPTLTPKASVVDTQPTTKDVHPSTPLQESVASIQVPEKSHDIQPIMTSTQKAVLGGGVIGAIAVISNFFSSQDSGFVEDVSDMDEFEDDEDNDEFTNQAKRNDKKKKSSSDKKSKKPGDPKKPENKNDSDKLDKVNEKGERKVSPGWSDPGTVEFFKNIKDSSAKNARANGYGNLFKNPKTDLWWSKDTAGHSGRHYKVFKETSKGLEWTHDADLLGKKIIDKHKSSVGKFIPWKAIIFKS